MRCVSHLIPAIPSSFFLFSKSGWAVDSGKLTPALIIQLRKILQTEDSTRGKRSVATCNRYLTALSSCCSNAVEKQILVENPRRKAKKLTEPWGRTRFLDDQEREKLIAAYKDNSPQLHLAVVLAFATGARRLEMIPNFSGDKER